MRRLFLSLLFLLVFEFSFAQPCNFPLPPSNTCLEAPLLCDLDGYCSNNSAAVNSGTPDAFCGQVENNNWVSFIAGSTEFIIEITVSNCNKNNGLQAQFFSTDNCRQFQSVSNCLDPVSDKATLKAENLIIGETYYLMMDGKGGDVCDYSYKLLEGNTLSPAHAEIKPVGSLCVNSSLILESVGTSPNANLTYHWSTPNGNIISNSNSSDIEINQPGIYKLVIENDGACIDSTEIIIPIYPNPLADIQQPDTINCVSKSSIYLHANSDDADNSFFWSTIESNIVSFENTADPLVDEPGLYQVLVTNPATGCTATALVEVTADIATPVARLHGGGELNCIVPSLTLDGIGSSVGDNFTYSLSSTGNNFQFNDQNLTATIDQPGIYNLLVTNIDNECTASKGVLVTLNDKKPTGADFSTYQPCYGYTGHIIIDRVDGGTLPYLYSLDSLTFSENTIFDSLTENNYHIVIQDATGCEWDTTIQIIEKSELIIDLGSDLFVNLGEDVNLNCDINFPESSIDSIFWMPNFECDTCLNHNFIPLKSQNYEVRIVDKNGCEIQDKLNITVNKKRNIYIPNVFSPNYDGINDEFFLFGGIGIESIVSFEIYDRWGSKICAHYDFQPNDRHFSWDGLINGKEADQGVYIYTALVKYIDGEVLDYVGDLTLMH